VKKLQPDSKKTFFDPWTFYRIGEAYYSLGNFVPALEYFDEACAKQNLNLDFQNKKAAALMQLGKIKEAKDVYEFILSEQPKHEAALSNLGFLTMREGNAAKAELLLKQAISLNPDHELALMNMALLQFKKGKVEYAEELAQRALFVNPQNVQAQQFLNYLRRNS
jgi:Flp pilus assembly protein TadD